MNILKIFAVLSALTLSACGSQTLDNSTSDLQGGASSQRGPSRQAPSSRAQTCGEFPDIEQYYVGAKLLAKGFNIYELQNKRVLGKAYFDAFSGLLDLFEEETNLHGKTVLFLDQSNRVIAKARLSILLGSQSYRVMDCNDKLLGTVEITLTSSLLSALGASSPASTFRILDAENREVAKSVRLKFGINSFHIGKVKIYETLLGWQINMNGSDLDPRVLTFIPIMKSYKDL